jgi:hypothetical protein
MLVAVVQAPGRALQILNEETGDEDGVLDVWCNGNPVPRDYIRQNLCVAFIPTDTLIIKYVDFWPAGPGCWGPAFKFELDTNQVRKLIRRKRLRPKRRRGPRAEYREKLIPQVMRQKAGEKGFTLPKRKQTILKEIQKHRARN